MNKRLSMPDGLRVIAIGLVMWFHIWQQSWLMPVKEIGPITIDLTSLVRTGYIMVDIMLLLSGYLLFIPIARGGRLDIIPFYKKRLIRIIPSYLLCILVMLFAFALPANGWQFTPRLTKDIFTHLTFTHTFFYDTYVSTSLNVVLWTLAIEMQFYLLFPLISAWFKKMPVFAYVTMTAAAMLFRRYAAGQTTIDMYINQLPAMLDVYANGMLAALFTAELEKHEQNKTTRMFFFIVSMFGFLILWRLIQTHYTELFPMEARKLGQLEHRFELSAAGGLILVSGESSFLLYKRLFSNTVTRFLSGISFNAYIWHQVLAVKIKEWKIPNYISENPASAGEMPWQLSYTLMCFVLSLAIAAALTYLFEIPITKMLSRVLNKITLTKIPLRYKKDTPQT